MKFAYRNPEIEDAIANARNRDDLDAALGRLADLVPSFMTPEIRGRQMFCPRLDALVSDLPRRLQLDDVPRAKSNDNVCILATRFYPTGGHSKVAADISRLIGAERVTIVFTDLYRQLRYSQLLAPGPQDRLYQRRATSILSAPTRVEKIVELYMLLAAVRPSRIFLLGNHMDMVAVAGAWPFRSVVDYVHHADHLPTLGATLPFSGHADLTYTCHLACKAAGLHPVWAGMTVEAGPGPAPRPAGAPLRLATCGALHKYRQPARHRWTDFVVAALKDSGAEMLHIGPWDESFAAEVAAALSAAGVDPQRYRFLGPVPDLREALVAHGVDFYLASYPDSGGKANLEAMSAGIVPIVPRPEDLGDLLQFDLPLEYWTPVTAPDEVPGAMARSLELRDALRSPPGQAALARELGRFDAFVTGAEPPA